MRQTISDKYNMIQRVTITINALHKYEKITRIKCVFFAKNET